jgi:hypothetical protein
MVINIYGNARFLPFCFAVTIVAKMKFRWTGRNVDLASLTTSADAFFANKGFSKKREETEKGELFLTYSLGREGKPLVADVKISGLSDDFEIELFLDRKAQTMARLGILSTLLGSGFYMKGRLENVAYAERLEGDFWDYVGEEIKRKSRNTKA